VGTGLGLSMIYGFVQQSGGHVRLRSELGQGTTVTIYLPRQPEGLVDVSEKKVVVDTPALTTTGVVLLNEADVRAVVRDILSNLGYAVLEAENGQAGLSIVASKVPIDLLLTGIGLPGGINGCQCADAARRYRPGLKVLFITGYAETMITGKSPMEEGMQVMMPFRLTTLASRVREIISG
jgi:CheY-like chemotaxis protein